jgi:hypothetical protein
VQRLGELDVLLGRQHPQPPLELGLPQRGGHVLAARRVGDGRLLEVEAGEGAGQPGVRLEQGARRRSGGRAFGEEAGVDGEQHRGVEVVGGDLDVGEVGHGQRGVGRGRALVEGLAGDRHLLAGGRGLAVDQRAPGGQRVPPGGPARVGGQRERVVGVVEEGEEGVGVVPVAGLEQTPQHGLEVAGGGAGRAAGHVCLQSRGGPAARAGSAG